MNMKYIRITVITILLVAVLFPADVLFSQTGVSFSWFLIRDDNAFKSRSEYEEFINTASLSLSRTYSYGNYYFQGFYGADLSVFSRTEDRKNHSQQVGIFSRYANNSWSTDFGAYARLRRNEAQYVFYNTNSFNFYVKFQYEPDLKQSYSFGLTFSKNEFNEFTDLDNITYRFYGKFQRYFQSRLSISADAGIGVKNYFNQVVYNYFGNTGGFMSRPRFTEDPVNAVMFSFNANIGKSITDKTGANAGFGLSRYIGDPIEAYSNGIYYYTENDLYDDPYSYEGRYASINLTRQLAVGFQAKIGALIQDKDYSGTPAITADGEVTGSFRMDSRKEYSLLISKKFTLERRFPGSMDLYFRFLIRSNGSNDPYYDFNDHLGIFGVTISK